MLTEKEVWSCEEPAGAWDGAEARVSSSTKLSRVYKWKR